MKALCLVLPYLAVTLVSADWPPLFTQPEQVHLALGEAPGSMTVTWVTMNTTKDSIVEYGVGALTMSESGTQSSFQDGGSLKRVLYIHRVLIKDLKPLQVYTYHVGGSGGWSPLFTFKMLRTDPNWSPRFAVYGDFGNSNAQSMPRLQQEVQRGHIDAVLHVGDMAYDMATDNALVGDEFMRQVESVAAYVPYMVCVGNHENHYNFSNYKARFTMPKAGGDGENIFFSFDIGPAHIISFSTEVYFYLQYGFQQILNQRRWLEEDLKKANANRAQRPWIITMGHRPSYCSNRDGDDCTKTQSRIRTQLEDLFYENGVDLMLWAHEHSYERAWPIYNYVVCNGTGSNVYDNPPAPVHITTGSAGCREDHDPFNKTLPWWSATRSTDYGYTHMTIHNGTHLELNQVSDDKNGTIIDSAMYIRNKHGAGVYTCHKHKDPAQENLLKEKIKLEKYQEQVEKWQKDQLQQQQLLKARQDLGMPWKPRHQLL